MTIWYMQISCCILKARHTHSEYVICIGFPLQKRLNERASMLRYLCIACLVDTSQTIRPCPGEFEMVRKSIIRLPMRALIQVEFGASVAICNLIQNKNSTVIQFGTFTVNVITSVFK